MADTPHLEPLLTQPLPDDLGVQAFLDGVARAFTAGDGEAVAALWETPALVLSDDMDEVIDTRGEIADFFGGARAQYNQLDIVDTKAEIVRLDELNDRLVCVRVRWPYLDRQGREVGAECSTYTLKRGGDAKWKIRVAVMHGQEALN
ncbi:hypothetical protein [Terricaulis sp.]|uniref:hypothetical protein n=1 Tax=Terricaulis sp. TaxID=2768686 RepID=UPI003784E7A7